MPRSIAGDEIGVNTIDYRSEKARGGAPRARILVLVALIVVVAASLAPWIRPPLSPDIRGTDLSLFPSTQEPQELLPPSNGIRSPALGSIGAMLIVVALLGSGWVLFFPKHIQLFAGILLCFALACTAAAAFNHPQLIELLGQESAQRQQLAGIATSADLELLISASNSRDAGGTWFAGDSQEVFGGLRYLVIGPWIIGFCSLFVLAVKRESLGRRALRLLMWFALAGVFALAICGQRVLAEFYWQQAKRDTEFASFATARRALQDSLTILPAFGRLARTWNLEGKLDLLDALETPRSLYYRARRRANAGDLEGAIALLRQVESDRTQVDSPARQWLARFLVQSGLRDFLRQRWAGANFAFREARRVAPEDCATAFLVGLVYDRAEKPDPAGLEKLFEPCLARLADRVLRADMLAILGDARFAAGDFTQARTDYLASMKAYHLPKRINYRAQRGLTGL